MKTDALKEQMQIEVEAEKVKAMTRSTRHAFHGANKVDWGGANGFDAFVLGDG